MTKKAGKKGGELEITIRRRSFKSTTTRAVTAPSGKKVNIIFAPTKSKSFKK
jgi:hypothetical protein